jgi:acetoacetyl-CoA synthetase
MAPSVRTIFWNPTADDIEQAPDTAFRRWVNEKHNLNLRDYWELHAWSIKDLNTFYEALWDYYGIIGSFERGKVSENYQPNSKQSY